MIAVYLFGSHVDGKARPDSDIDIAVLLRPGIKRDTCRELAFQFTCDLIRFLKHDRIDILVMNTSGPIIRQKVYKYGRMIFCRDRKKALRHKDISIAEYLDFLPFRRRSEEAMKRRIHGGRRSG